MSKRPKIKLAIRLNKDEGKGLWRAIRLAAQHPVLIAPGIDEDKLKTFSRIRLARRLAMTHRFRYIAVYRSVQAYSEKLAKRFRGVRGCIPYGGYFRFTVTLPEGVVLRPACRWQCRMMFCPHCHSRRIAYLHKQLTDVQASRFELLTLSMWIGEQNFKDVRDLIKRFNENLGQKLRGQRFAILRMLESPSRYTPPTDRWLKVRVLILDPRPSRIRWDAFQALWSRSRRPVERLEGVWDPKTSPELVLSLWRLPSGLYDDQAFNLEAAASDTVRFCQNLKLFSTSLK